MYIPKAWDYVQNWWRYRENDISTKQWVDPESMSVEKLEMLGIREDERGTRRELGLEKADTLSRTTSDVAQAGPMQSSVCAEV